MQYSKTCATSHPPSAETSSVPHDDSFASKKGSSDFHAVMFTLASLSINSLRIVLVDTQGEEILTVNSSRRI